jgi:hypothetical protein
MELLWIFRGVFNIALETDPVDVLKTAGEDPQPGVAPCGFPFQFMAFATSGWKRLENSWM